MPTQTAAIAYPEANGLSQVERVVDTFVAPSKTFADILRSTSWWLPLVLMILSSFATALVVQRQVGFERVSENQIHQSPRQEDAFNQLTPEQRASRLAITAKITRGITFGYPVVLVLFFALYSLIVWAAFNFGLGAQTTFPRVFAVTFYAALPFLLLSVLSIVTLYLGNNAENYDIKNPVGTNLAYYLPDVAPWLKALLNSFDLIRLWSLALQVLGMAIIARKTITQSAVIIVGLWAIGVIFQVVAASFS